MYNNLQPTADYRTGRFGDTAAGKGRAISPNPYTYSVPTSTGAQLNTYLNPPRTADSKPAKSLSPSKYNVPTAIVGGGTTPSNYSPYNKIFTPITPSLTTNQINTKYNQVSSGASTNATNSPYDAKYGVSPSTYSLPSDFTNLTNHINTPYKPSQYYPPSSIYSTTNTVSPPKSNSDLGKKDSNSNSSHSSPNYSPVHNQPAKISVQGSGESIAATKEDLVLLNRAKCVMEAGYIDPKKDSPSNNKGEEEFGRFSVIKSNFKENPYYYNLDDLPSFRQNTLKTLDSYNEDSSRMSAPSLFQFSIKLDNKIGDYKTFLQKLKGSGQRWRDESFPPTIHSLVGDNPSRRRDWQDLVWLRPEEFYGENYNLFVGKIEPNDIKQGALGDCYFLSVLSSLAEWPDRIRKIFVDKEKNPLGCYCVRMCVMGEWREIVVDDYFPCDKRTKKPVFTIGNENELWVLILEKAWAKIYGSYDNIEAGLARECLHDLTCAPTTFFLTDDKNEWDTIWKKMLKCEKKNYAMTCGAGDFFMSLSRSNSFQGGYDMVNSKGLVGSHAYSLLGAYEVQSKRGKVKLLKLRNPWGKTEWNGAWSDNSSEWDEGLKRTLMPEKKDDGVFFIEYSDFLKYFTDIQFCFVNDSFKYSHILTQSESKHAGYFRFTITQAGKYYFTINQESKRKFSSTGRDKYATVTIVLAKLNKVSNKWEYEHIAGNHRADREVWVKAKLESGEYMIYSKIWWSQFGENDYALSSYGPTKVKFEQVNKKDYPELLQGAFSSKARKSTKKIDYAREGEPKAYSVVELKDGFVYCYYHNDSKRVLNVEVNYKEFSGLRLRKPYRGRQYQLSVNPGESKVVLAKVLPQENVRQAFSERARFTNYDGPLPVTSNTTTPSYQPTSNYSATPTPKANTYNSTYQPPLPNYKPINPVITNPIIANPITTPIIPTTTTTTKSDLEILAKIKGKKEKLQKPNSKESLDIYVYEYKYEDGVILLYENLTRNWTLNERVEYVGKGLFLLQAKSSGPVQEAEFELRPGSTYKLDFRRIEANPTLKLKFYSKFKESNN